MRKEAMDGVVKRAENLSVLCAREIWEEQDALGMVEVDFSIEM